MLGHFRPQWRQKIDPPQTSHVPDTGLVHSQVTQVAGEGGIQVAGVLGSVKLLYFRKTQNIF